ncbi:MAG: hypothetical protein HN704_11945 [Bacteroidetes bacterium]|jgi:tetratricopeptide (TPR) repeat protein|nr:hypothetical protein [Bacteroidota bacterium]MBT7142123.1 hypothetical protein [Bacteroidota bacterium]MBT7492303.1 hypothetical protein [Bacteroidota bacterium]
MKNILLLILVLLSISATAQSYLADEWIEKGKQQSRDGNYYAAINSFQKAKEYAPLLEDIYYLLGINYKAIDNCAKAKQSFRKYIELNPTASDINHVKKLIRTCGKTDWTETDVFRRPIRSYFGLFYEMPLNLEVSAFDENLGYMRSFYPIIAHGFGIQAYKQKRKKNSNKRRNLNYEFNIIYRYFYFMENIYDGKTVHNIELNFLNWRFMPRSPAFQTGNIVYRPMFSFGCGLGMNTGDDPGFAYTGASPNDDDNMAKLLMKAVNYFSWHATIGTHISTKNNPSGLVIECAFQGVEQFRSIAEINSPNIIPFFCLRIGWFFGLRGR